ncbi:pentatricopeptide repeat-containing protein At2g17033 [Durio zibethinus]|uniref:Pentatricopeptide repeat-containing protein At2g17033 n=1 Tax=Durio zibethinus TaxID=66656 RepID=A0A6P5Z719_DURZI|nr:pentatricopeptide repeat-containing protein At2g17033 [Durio zibethinus]
MIGSLMVTIPSPWNHHRLRLRPTLPLIKCESGGVPLTKQGHRFLSSLVANAGVNDHATANRLIKKFVASSPKSVALNALSHLLSPRNSQPNLAALAFPLYTKISETSWYNWNPKLVADLIALLYNHGNYNESEGLISQAVSKLKFRERDLVQFYCNLIESCSKHESNRGFNDAYGYLSELVGNSSSVYVKRQGYISMVGSLCEMGSPNEAVNVVEEMRKDGLKPSLFEFRSILYGYGKLGLFEDMERMVCAMEIEGFEVDTICSNMVLSSYGGFNALPNMVPWLQKMKTLQIPFSVRTYNSVLNSCPVIMSLVQGSDGFPLSLRELVEVLTEDEALLVKELVESSSVLDEAMEWNGLEAKLDLHGMHLGSAYLIMLQWIEEMKCRFKVEECVIPAQITIVCGSGKHSSVRGESPVKTLIREMMVQMKSPMKIDRKNIGCFIAKGQVVRNWLYQL